MMIDGRIEAVFTVPSSVTLRATTNAAGPTTVTIAAGQYAGMTAFCTYLATALQAQQPVTAGIWTVAFSTVTGRVTIAVTNSVYSIVWDGTSGTSTTLRDLLGFTGNVAAQATATGASHVIGAWFPEVPLIADTDIEQAPTVTDRRQTRSPSGYVVTHSGQIQYRHKGLVWSNVSLNRVWISEETTGGGLTNQAYERFHLDAIEGFHTWFVPGSSVLIWDHRGTQMGSAKSVTTWQPVNTPQLSDLKMSIANWIGQWRIEWPELAAEA